MGVAIGVNVQAYDPNYAKINTAQTWTAAQTWSVAQTFNASNNWVAEQTFKAIKDTVYTITDGAAFEIDPANGAIQVVTLGDDRTPAATNFAAGHVLLLGVDDGSAYTIDWTTVDPTWVKVGGSGAAPTLATTGYTWILLWKVSTTIYATEVGQP
jgi:hypothetical protein